MNTLAVKPLTDNEREWIETLRLMTQDSVPAPTLRAIQAIRLGLSHQVFSCPRQVGAACSGRTNNP